MTDRYRVPICIIGFGNVGQHLAFALIGRVPEILVFTRGTRAPALGALGDIETAAVIDGRGTRVRRIESLAEVPPDALVVQTAKEGYSYKDYPPENLRLAGLKFDAPLIRTLSEQLATCGFRGRYINVSNPTNAMTAYAQRFLRLPPERVLAFGSALDGGRWAQQILASTEAAESGLASADLECPVLGEHGPSMVFAETGLRVRRARVALESLLAAARDAAPRALRDGVRIATLQGGTWYGPVRGLLRSVHFLLAENHPRTCEGVLFDGHYVGVPASKRGGRVLTHVEDLSTSERAALDRSLAQVADLYETLLRAFDSDRQRRDVLFLDDEPGLARSLARLVQLELRDDPELASSYRLFVGHEESPAALFGGPGGVIQLESALVGDRVADGLAPDQPIVGGPDLLVFDQLLGGGAKGLDAARRIKERYQNARVVIFTGHSGISDVAAMANEQLETRSGRRVKVVDAVVLKSEHGERELVETVRTLLRETQYRTA